MREVHSNAAEGTALLLRQQRELTESTGKKEFRRGEKESDIIGWNDEHTHTHTHTHKEAGR